MIKTKERSYDIADMIPSRQNLARLLTELNTPEMDESDPLDVADTPTLCIGCEYSRATRTNNTLCQECWEQAEGFQSDDY